MLTDHKPGDWFKSTFSGQGGNCVQTTWTRAAACPSGDCVQVKGEWHKSSASGTTACVEVAEGRVLKNADDLDHVLVRDSKLGDKSPVLHFTPAEWRAFIAGVKAGEFDLPEDV